MKYAISLRTASRVLIIEDMNGIVGTPAQDSGIEKIFGALARHARAKDRGYPPVFVGRAAEMKILRDAVLDVAENGTPGQTHVVQGVPGAGKTALLTHFANEMGKAVVGGKTVCVAKMQGDELASTPIDLVSRISANAEENQQSRTGKALRFAGDVVAQMKMGQSAYQTLNARYGLSERSSLGACLKVYAENVWPDNTCMVLAFDETQNCPVTDTTKSNLGVLHNEAPARHALTVCFGLSNTGGVLRRAGLSRPGKKCVVEIGTLLSGEGREVLEKTLAHLGVDWSNGDWRDYVGDLGFAESSWTAWRDALVERLDAETSDFPQHLTAAAISVCEALIEHRDEPAAQWGRVANDIARRLDEGKEEYYDGRLSDGLEFHRTALGALIQAGETGRVLWENAVDVLTRGTDGGHPVPRDEASRMLALAANRGALARIEIKMDGNTEICAAPSPTPSMSKHLAGRFDRKFAAGDPVAVRIAEHLGIGRDQTEPETPNK